jgi:hypothetical protein
MAKYCEPCGKKQHPTQGAALAAALRAARRFGPPTRAYRCPHGNGWHLTTKPQRKGGAVA